MKKLKKDSKIAIEILLNYDDYKIGAKSNSVSIKKLKSDFQEGLKYLIEKFADGRDNLNGNIFNIESFTLKQRSNIDNVMTLRNLRCRYRFKNNLNFKPLCKIK